MPDLSDSAALLAWQAPAWLDNSVNFIKVLMGFSIIIFVHELGHFLAAKWVGVRVDRFAVGFGPRLFGYRRGEGLTFGNRPDYRPEELAEKSYGETDYCFRALPVGGYVKMLGQDDIIIDEKTGDAQITDDPRAFPRRPVGQRMIVASAGVVFNLLFAALLMMGVFLVGKQDLAPKVGYVAPDSPADGRLQANDEILSINGVTTRSWFDVQTLTAFAREPVNVTVRRGDTIVHDIPVPPEVDSDGLSSIGIAFGFTTHCIADGPLIPGRTREQGIMAGDTIVTVDGAPVSNGFDVIDRFARSEGRLVEITVQRPDPANPGQTHLVTVHQRARIAVHPRESLDGEKQADSSSILGMSRRIVIGQVSPGMPADEAGLKVGDVIATWGAIANPTYAETIEVIRASAGRPVPVSVERPNEKGIETIELEVTPRRPFSMWGDKPAIIGVAFLGVAEEYRAIVADIQPGSPAAELNIPRGAELIEVDGQPISDWFDVVRALQGAAGREITVQYRSGGATASGTMHVPSSLVNELGLPATARILEIDGQKKIQYPGPDGRPREAVLPSLGAVARMLKSKIEHADPETGQTPPVTLKIAPTLSADPILKQYTPRPDALDPWQLRIGYSFDLFVFDREMTTVSADGNPALALYMGGQFIVQQLRLTYAAFVKMATREVGTQQMAGPVGIVSMAIQQARLGWTELVFFLAYLSISLAVINFLPIPVLDGGLMVFLIIEKVKGKPLSFKTQMISTLVGLGAILLMAVFVTIQDIGRLIG